MEPPSVGFDHQAVPTPEKVNLERLVANPKQLIATWDWQIPLGEKWQQLRLHPTAKSEGWIATPILKDAAKPRAATAAWAGEDPVNLGHVEHLQDRSLLDSSTKRGIADHASQVNDGPRRTGAGYGFMQHHFFAKRRRHVVAANSGDLASEFVGGDDVDSAGLALPKAQEKRGGPVGHHGARSACEHRGEHSAPRADIRMTDAKRRAKERKQSAGNDGVIDCGIRHPDLTQLSTRHDAVLLFSQRGYLVPPTSSAVPLPRHLVLRHSAKIYLPCAPPLRLSVFFCLPALG